MIMAVAALLKATPHPTDDEIDASITNICRCGTYPRMRKAIHAAAAGRGRCRRRTAGDHPERSRAPGAVAGRRATPHNLIGIGRAQGWMRLNR